MHFAVQRGAGRASPTGRQRFSNPSWAIYFDDCLSRDQDSSTTLKNKEENGRAFEGRKPSKTLNSHQHSFNRGCSVQQLLHDGSELLRAHAREPSSNLRACRAS